MKNFLQNLSTSLRSLKAPRWLVQDDPYESLGPSVIFLDRADIASDLRHGFMQTACRMYVACAARSPRPICPSPEHFPSLKAANGGATVVSMEEWLAQKLSAGSIK